MTDLDVSRFINSEHIADLKTIPFDLERYGIAPEIAPQIYGEQAAQLRSLGQRYMDLANERLHDRELAAADIEHALDFFAQARQLDDKGNQAIYDSLTAEVHLLQANLFLSHREYEEMLEAARKGQQFKVLPMLRVYETFGLLLFDRFDQAKSLALELRQDTTTAVPPYYQNYGQALAEELYYYQTQMGISHPNFERFGKVLAGEE